MSSIIKSPKTMAATMSGKKFGLLIVLSILTMACNVIADDIFEVQVGSDNSASAVITLCGSQKHLQRRGAVLTTVHRIDCEGSGVIEVSVRGRLVRCPIGYVTPGLGSTTWRYVIRGQNCVAIGP